MTFPIFSFLPFEHPKTWHCSEFLDLQNIWGNDRLQVLWTFWCFSAFWQPSHYLDCSLPCNILALLFPVCLEPINALAQKMKKELIILFWTSKDLFWTDLCGDGVRFELCYPFLADRKSRYLFTPSYQLAPTVSSEAAHIRLASHSPILYSTWVKAEKEHHLLPTLSFFPLQDANFPVQGGRTCLHFVISSFDWLLWPQNATYQCQQEPSNFFYLPSATQQNLKTSQISSVPYNHIYPEKHLFLQVPFPAMVNGLIVAHVALFLLCHPPPTLPTCSEHP